MQFLTVSTRRARHFSNEQFETLVAEEVEQARILYGEGCLRQIWHRADVPGACIIFEAASEEEVRDKLESLPMMKAGLLEVTIIPLTPYAGFAARRTRESLSASATPDGHLE